MLNRCLPASPAAQVRLREAELLLGLTNVWETHHYHLFSSFRREHVYYKVRRWYGALSAQAETLTCGVGGRYGRWW